jgi:hypothetical protein
MNKDYTHIAMIIDRSGSMSGGWPDVAGGYTEIIKENKALPGKCTFTLAAFDNEYLLLEDFTDIKDVKETLSVSPRGMTALLDAIGKTIVSVGEKLAALDENERPEKVLVMVQTDGMENSSKEFKREDIKKLVEKQTNDYKWQFIFLGATLDSVNDAQTMGFMRCNSSTYNAAHYGSTVSLMGDKMSGARGAVGACGLAGAAGFTDEERKKINK